MALTALLLAGSARAERPFLTDDADVIGAGGLELQSWTDAALGRRGLRSALFWNLAVGVVEPLELAGGGAIGIDPQGRPTVQNPYVQGKLRLLERQEGLAPGLALAAQVSAPVGQGTLADERGRLSAYGAFTWRLGPGGRVHANVGFGAALEGRQPPRAGPLWSLGVELPLLPEGLYLALEVAVPDPAEYREAPVLYQSGLVLRAAPGLSLDVVVGAGPRDDLQLFGERWAPWAQVGVQLETDLLP